MRGLVPSIALLLAASTASVATQNSTCAKGLYMIVARGTGEAEGTGATGELADEIAKQIEGSKIEPLDYPATFTDPDYDDSEKDGVKEMTDLITEYHSACPDNKMAVLGYSQGGQVASDVFCGGSGGTFGNNSALSSKLVKDSVVAVVLFGDPSHVANVSYDRGTSVNNGLFKRNDTSICEGYADLLRSYCDTGDVYCDLGEDRAVHRGYVEKYGDEVVKFVVKQFEDAKDNESSSSSTTASSTASRTASGTSISQTATSSTTPDSAAAPSLLGGGLQMLTVPLAWAVFFLAL